MWVFTIGTVKSGRNIISPLKGSLVTYARARISSPYKSSKVSACCKIVGCTIFAPEFEITVKSGLLQFLSVSAHSLFQSFQHLLHRRNHFASGHSKLTWPFLPFFKVALLASCVPNIKSLIWIRPLSFPHCPL